LNFKDYLKKIRPIVLKICIAFFAFMIIFGVILILDLFGLKELLLKIMNEMTKNLSGLINEQGQIKTIDLILNNLRVSLLAIVAGIVPFLFLPMVILLINSVILGVMMGIFAGQSVKMSILMFLAGVLPHGIFELTAIFISVACGTFLCSTVTKKIRGKNKGAKISNVIKNSLKAFFIIVVPLIVVAGLIESFVTPAIIMRVIR
jgi:stage II sporulation protein M